MSQIRSLSCQDPETGALKMVETAHKSPKPGEIEIAVAAASVNPIDVLRATGYGRKLLSLLGAGKFPMVLGNDFAGTVCALGEGVAAYSVGDRVFGAQKPSRAGTHASHILVKAEPETVAFAPDELDLQSIAALPYSFTTMWLAVQGAGLDKLNARGKKVLIHGAAGGLGSLAVQMLSDWGCEVTAIAFPRNHDTCLELGASSTVDLSSTSFDELAGSFDATLNFATWDHDQQLLGCLKEYALGHATTVHPMLRSFDSNGLIGGAIGTFLAKRNSRKALPTGTNNYQWTIFQPKADALAELVRLLKSGRAKLEIGLEVPLSEGKSAFDHIKGRKAGRALIIP